MRKMYKMQPTFHSSQPWEHGGMCLVSISSCKTAPRYVASVCACSVVCATKTDLAAKLALLVMTS